jgi:SREBP regulating gene protein
MLLHITDVRATVLCYTIHRYLQGCQQKGALALAYRCSGDDNCCSVYEQCVSCCMKPANNAMDAVKRVYRGPDRCLLWLGESVHVFADTA